MKYTGAGGKHTCGANPSTLAEMGLLRLVWIFFLIPKTTSNHREGGKKKEKRLGWYKRTKVRNQCSARGLRESGSVVDYLK